MNQVPIRCYTMTMKTTARIQLDKTRHYIKGRVMSHLKVGITDVPNDVFMWVPWITGQVKGGIELQVEYHDIAALNQRSVAGDLDVVKISYSHLGPLLDQYWVLPMGSAIVTHGGPLVVAKKPLEVESLVNCRLLSPGESTTAHLLFQDLLGQVQTIQYLGFEEMIPRVLQSESDIGLVIHGIPHQIEAMGLHIIADLTQLWQAKYQLPLPLGGLVARKSLGAEKLEEICRLLDQSLTYSQQHRVWSVEKCLQLCRHFRDKDTIECCIDQWVSIDTQLLSDRARRAIAKLLSISGNGMNKGSLFFNS